jgi:hypothetical protein
MTNVRRVRRESAGLAAMLGAAVALIVGVGIVLWFILFLGGWKSVPVD